MAQGLFTLISLCAVMAAASFLAGILPLAFNLSPARLRMISMIGMGVLVGTSLIVIIPEGVETLYSSGSVHAHSTRDILQSRNVGVPDLPQVAALQPRYDPAFELSTPGPVSTTSRPPPGPVIPEGGIPPKTPTDPNVVGILEVPDKHEAEEVEEAHHAWVGIALIAGFILMFLIDKLPQYTTSNKPSSHTRHISLTNLGRRFNLTTLDREEEADTFLDTAPATDTASRGFATTIGLVIHAAADGIALGASSSSTNTSLSLVIFFAIMVHKAPAAFGLTSILLKQGLSKRAARAHLVMFSLSAPAGAFITFTLASILGRGNSSLQSSQWWTGVLLLFSAGTFLYVAMHSMQDMTSAEHHKPAMNGSTNNESRESVGEKPSIADLGAAVFGMILPLFLQVGHAH